MYSKFLNLDAEKQDRMINAAMKEFAQKGYALASTNQIVKEAGISKGLLFHYFKNKKQLFLFLFDYGYDMIVEEFYQKVDLSIKDFFARSREAIMIKMELLTGYPDVFKFMENALLEDSAEIKDELEKKKKEFLNINLEKFYEGIDYSRFREDVNLKIVLKVINFTLEKLSDEALYEAKLSPTHEFNYEKLRLETEEYFEVLKQCFYKQ
ncbi:TetR/AcrR family transcriptional regulator [Bacillus tuaregi]|uniref:TetR/AcrR family transcriptional regulator n=1 Tax=Bacillus tuaregi TaxID=1816695 RepID=UPI0008F83E87|nr:TetR/AcrR family transcriptional regulator [Bacillus tuaregi]